MKIQTIEEMLDTNDIIKKSVLYQEEKQMLLDQYEKIYKIKPDQSKNQFNPDDNYQNQNEQ